MDKEPIHVCIVPFDGYVAYEASNGMWGSDPCLGRPWREIADEIIKRLQNHYPNATFEITEP